MDSNSYKLEDVLSALCEHAMPHAKEFRKPTLGRPVNIHNLQDMKKHVIETLYHSETKSFGAQNSRDFFYNPHTNTLIVMNFSKDEKGNIHGGTVFRPAKGEQRFNKLHEIESGRDQQDLLIHQKNGIVALRPEVAKEFAQTYLQKMQGKGQNLDKSNPSPKPDLNEKKADLTKPSVATTELTVKSKQEGGQAKPLASRKLTR